MTKRFLGWSALGGFTVGLICVIYLTSAIVGRWSAFDVVQAVLLLACLGLAVGFASLLLWLPWSRVRGVYFWPMCIVVVSQVPPAFFCAWVIYTDGDEGVDAVGIPYALLAGAVHVAGILRVPVGEPWTHRIPGYLALAPVVAGIGYLVVTFPAYYEFYSTLVAPTLIILAAVALPLMVLRGQVDLRPSASIPLPKRIDVLRRNLRDSSEVFKEVFEKLEQERQLLAKLEEDIQEKRRLAGLSGEEAESVQRYLDKVGGRQQYLFFILGLIAAIPLGVAGNYVYDSIFPSQIAEQEQAPAPSSSPPAR